MDESSNHHFQPEMKQQLEQWKHLGSPPLKKAKTVMSAGKMMASIFWDAGVFLVDYLDKGHTITRVYYADLLSSMGKNKADLVWQPDKRSTLPPG